MAQISIKIEQVLEESKKNICIATIAETFEGETIKQAVGKALHFAFQTMNSQYDAPKVTVAGIELTTAMSKKFCTADFNSFRLDFAILRETIMSQLAAIDDDAAIEFMRSSDTNKVFAGQTNFTDEQVAAQAKAHLRKVKYMVRFLKEDAQSSVYDERIEQRIALNQEKAKQYRLLQKAAKAEISN